ncbi:MAG: right-handed parallel beta-helix repeat-containing protein [Thermoguttaceae bacterium]
MSCRRASLCALLCLLLWLSIPRLAAAQQPAKPDTRPVLEITQNTTLDPAKTYGRIVIKASGITVDGAGASVVGVLREAERKAFEVLTPTFVGVPPPIDPAQFQGVGVSAKGVSNVTLRNLNIKNWQTGLKIEDGSNWTVENCTISENFHVPAMGWHWGDYNGRGGIVLKNVNHSKFLKNKANKNWDACELIHSDDNLVENNDFSWCSNTCMWLWTACRNQVKNCNLSHGIRCLPRVVHANDSACVLVEDGSDDNHFTDNDITYGGDGVFIRGTGGWGSRGNVFERNDASYAHNNCFESQSPGNTYRHNKANHGSHGLFLGGSRDTIVEDNEACYNGELKGLHNAPWTFTYVPGGPQVGATGIFFAGSSADHVRCRRNKCIGNNGGGIAIFGIPSVKASDHIAHWIIENNEIRDNRWGIYMEFADWIDIAGNVLDHNWEGNLIQGGTVTNFSQYADNPKITCSPKAALVGPSVGVEGKEFVLDASGTTDPGSNPLTFRWDLGDGTLLSTPRVAHIFKAPGYYNVGMTVNNGRFSDLGSRGFRVVDDCPELGTEGQAADWDWEEVVPRQNLYWDPKTPNNAPAPPAQVVATPQSRIEFSNDADCLAGKSSVLVRYWPVANQVRVIYPKSRQAGIPLAGKTRLVFWSKLINGGIHSWPGLNPVITLYESPQKFAILKPAMDPANWMHGEREEGANWMYRSIPLTPPAGAMWRRQGELPATLNYLTIEFGPAGSQEVVRLWIDAMAIR